MLNNLISAFPIIFALIVIFSQPDGIEKINSKRSVKGKQALTADEYNHKVKRDRIIACIILAVGWIISQLIINFA
jgi:energy-converting hydrogenase Eha subunit H